MEEIRKKRIIVFVASPGDLKEERMIADQMFSEFQSLTDKTLYELKPIFWEDMGPEYGRPQDIINRGVHNCDIFVGLLWKRWGTPTGNFSSGFEEEYSIVKNRYRESNGMEPKIWLYFKNAPEPEEIQDDSDKEGFKKVLDFKKQIEATQEAFIVSFRDSREWERIFRKKIFSYLGDKYGSQSLTSVEKAVSGEVVSVAKQVLPTAKSLAKPSQALTRIQTLIEEVSNNIKSEKEINEISSAKRLRLFLFSASIFYETEILELLGSHEINLLYANKEQIKLLRIEQKFILRTMLGDSNSVKAGWFWFSGSQAKNTKEYFIYLAFKDRDENVKKGAIKLLKHFWSKSIERHLCHTLKDDSAEVVKESLSALAEFGSPQSIVSIENILNHEEKDVRKAAWLGKFAILSRSNLPVAISFLAETAKEERGWALKYISDVISRVSLADLEKLKDDVDDGVKLLAYKELAKKGELRDGDLQKIINSELPELRYFAHKLLIERGYKFNPKAIRDTWPQQTLLGGFPISRDFRDEIILEIFKQYSLDELEKNTDWIGSDAPIAYLALGLLDFNVRKDQIRNDLNERFKRIKDKSIDDLASKFSQSSEVKEVLGEKVLEPDVLNLGVQAARTIVAQTLSKHDDYVIEQFAVSALKVLTLYGNLDDKKFALMFLDAKYFFVKDAAYELLIKFAEPSDLSHLVEIAFNSHGSICSNAINKALSFDRNGEVKQKFLRSSEPVIIRICFKSRQAFKIDEVINLLYNDKTEIRLLALSYLVSRLRRNTLIKLLVRYINNGSYYYNVVCWLDRILFAPRNLRKVFRDELLSKTQ